MKTKPSLAVERAGRREVALLEAGDECLEWCGRGIPSPRMPLGPCPVLQGFCSDRTKKETAVVSQSRIHFA